jgi:hypothetical protein
MKSVDLCEVLFISLRVSPFRFVFFFRGLKLICLAFVWLFRDMLQVIVVRCIRCIYFKTPILLLVLSVLLVLFMMKPKVT